MSNHRRFSRRLVIVPSLFLIILLIQHVFKRSNDQVVRIEGQWKDIRQTLGLPALSDTIHFQKHDPANSSERLPRPRSLSSRFFKRTIHFNRDTPQLYFSPDALEEPKLSYEELLESFRSTALREEILQEEKRNAQQLQKQVQGQGRKGKERKKEAAKKKRTEFTATENINYDAV